jgi:hypothetical protein
MYSAPDRQNTHASCLGCRTRRRLLHRKTSRDHLRGEELSLSKISRKRRTYQCGYTPFHRTHAVPQDTRRSTGHTPFHRTHAVPHDTRSSTGHTQFHRTHAVPQDTRSSTGHTQFHRTHTVPQDTRSSTHTPNPNCGQIHTPATTPPTFTQYRDAFCIPSTFMRHPFGLITLYHHATYTFSLHKTSIRNF